MSMASHTETGMYSAENAKISSKIRTPVQPIIIHGLRLMPKGRMQSVRIANQILKLHAKKTMFFEFAQTFDAPSNSYTQKGINVPDDP